MFLHRSNHLLKSLLPVIQLDTSRGQFPEVELEPHVDPTEAGYRHWQSLSAGKERFASTGKFALFRSEHPWTFEMIPELSVSPISLQTVNDNIVPPLFSYPEIIYTYSLDIAKRMILNRELKLSNFHSLKNFFDFQTGQEVLRLCFRYAVENEWMTELDFFFRHLNSFQIKSWCDFLQPLQVLNARTHLIDIIRSCDALPFLFVIQLIKVREVAWEYYYDIGIRPGDFESVLVEVFIKQKHFSREELVAITDDFIRCLGASKDLKFVAQNWDGVFSKFYTLDRLISYLPERVFKVSAKTVFEIFVFQEGFKARFFEESLRREEFEGLFSASYYFQSEFSDDFAQFLIGKNLKSVVLKNLSSFHNISLQTYHSLKEDYYFDLDDVVREAGVFDEETQKVILKEAVQDKYGEGVVHHFLSGFVDILDQAYSFVRRLPLSSDEIKTKIEFYKRRRMYAELRRACRIFSHHFPFLPDEAAVELKSLIKNHDWLSAYEFALGMQNAGIEVKTEVKAELKEKAQIEQMQRKNRVMRTVDLKSHDLLSSLIHFYVRLSLINRIEKLKKIIGDDLVREKFTPRFYYKLNNLEEMLKTKLTEGNKSMQQWVREFLVYAVATELSLQRQLRDLEHDVRYRGQGAFLRYSWEEIKYFIATSTPEEIRNYLYQAQVRFYGQEGAEGKWQKGFGGAKWADIAKTAEILWQDLDSDQIVIWLDHAFDLQHNGGTVFSKSPLSIRNVYSYVTLSFLDLKAKSSRTEELLDFVEMEKVEGDFSILFQWMKEVQALEKVVFQNRVASSRSYEETRRIAQYEPFQAHLMPWQEGLLKADEE